MGKRDKAASGILRVIEGGKSEFKAVQQYLNGKSNVGAGTKEVPTPWKKELKDVA